MDTAGDVCMKPLPAKITFIPKGDSLHIISRNKLSMQRRAWYDNSLNSSIIINLVTRRKCASGYEIFIKDVHVFVISTGILNSLCAVPPDFNKIDEVPLTAKDKKKLYFAFWPNTLVYDLYKGFLS